jgi:hypothetical protein
MAKASSNAPKAIKYQGEDGTLIWMGVYWPLVKGTELPTGVPFSALNPTDWDGLPEPEPTLTETPTEQHTPEVDQAAWSPENMEG